ncbi:MAG: type II toxin-antitoxin system HicB family antitoxin [Pseudomonadota bacterium]
MAIKPEYPVALRPLSAAEGGGWVALVPDLPGCMSDGETAYEALENVENAISEWQEAAREMGRAIPKPDEFLNQQLVQQFPDHIRKQAEQYAKMMADDGSIPDRTAVHAILTEWARSSFRSLSL